MTFRTPLALSDASRRISLSRMSHCEKGISSASQAFCKRRIWAPSRHTPPSRIRAVVKQPSPNWVALSLAGSVSCSRPLIKNMVAPYAWRLSLAGCGQPDKGISPNKKGPASGPFFIVSDQPDSDLFEDQRAVSPTEAEGVTQGILHTANLARFVRNEVQIATFIWIIQVDGWRYSLIAQRENRVD